MSASFSAIAVFFACFILCGRNFGKMGKAVPEVLSFDHLPGGEAQSEHAK
jgi:hypothetical protein